MTENPEKEYVVTVALKPDISPDVVTEARHRMGSLIRHEDTRRGAGFASERLLWTLPVNASNLAEAADRAVQITTDAFTEGNPEAEPVAVAIAWIGWYS